MQEIHPPYVPDIDPATIAPRSFEPGVYVSRSPLPAPDEEAGVLANYEISLDKSNTHSAIGMAAIPKDSKGEQLVSLEYKGMTSADYADRHQQWLEARNAEAARAEHQAHLTAKALRSELTDDDDDDDSEHGRSRRRAGSRR